MIENEQYKLVGRSKADLRAKDDFYPTPEWVSRILVKPHRFSGKIWECACGDGALAMVLKESGYEVIPTDLVWHGFGCPGVDFLLETKTSAPNIVTNPPFNLAYEFMEHGYYLTERSLVLLLPIRYLAGLKRAKFYQMKPPRKIIIIPKKIDFLGTANPVMEFAWYVWDKEHSGPTEVIWANWE